MNFIEVIFKEEERGSTTNISILDTNKMDLSWERTEKNRFN
jgi:hypothetical protein